MLRCGAKPTDHSSISRVEADAVTESISDQLSIRVERRYGSCDVM